MLDLNLLLKAVFLAAYIAKDGKRVQPEYSTRCAVWDDSVIPSQSIYATWIVGSAPPGPVLLVFQV